METKDSAERSGAKTQRPLKCGECDLSLSSTTVSLTEATLSKRQLFKSHIAPSPCASPCFSVCVLNTHTHSRKLAVRQSHRTNQPYGKRLRVHAFLLACVSDYKLICFDHSDSGGQEDGGVGAGITDRCYRLQQIRTDF